MEASVDAMPFPRSYFDVVTAFETIYFWPDLEDGLREMLRVVRTGGRLVVDEYPDLAAAGKWADRLGMNVPDAEELTTACRRAGFARVTDRHHPVTGGCASSPSAEPTAVRPDPGRRSADRSPCTGIPRIARSTYSGGHCCPTAARHYRRRRA